MKDFKKLLIWQKAMDITDLVFDMYEELPWQKVAELKGQSTRAAISIVFFIYLIAAACNLFIPDTGVRYPKADFEPIKTEQ